MTTIKLSSNVTIEIADTGYIILTDRTPGMGIGDRFNRIGLSRDETRALYHALRDQWANESVPVSEARVAELREQLKDIEL